MLLFKCVVGFCIFKKTGPFHVFNLFISINVFIMISYSCVFCQLHGICGLFFFFFIILSCVLLLFSWSIYVETNQSSFLLSIFSVVFCSILLFYILIHIIFFLQLLPCFTCSSFLRLNQMSLTWNFYCF